jgi:magnesium-protoporphyrin O-methyltransferase
MQTGYALTRDRLEEYFDRTAMRTWERLTSDAPVSRVRQTVREGRDRMRAMLLDRLPADLHGARVLDAGCGAGQLAMELAGRGAGVVAVDISPRLLEIARDRTPDSLQPRIDYLAGDMLAPSLGAFDFVVAMDSLIHYRTAHIADALDTLARRTAVAIAFTVAPRTPLLGAMHLAGKLFPRGDRSPAIVPQDTAALARLVAQTSGRRLQPVGRVSTGFYISQAMELRP